MTKSLITVALAVATLSSAGCATDTYDDRRPYAGGQYSGSCYPGERRDDHATRHPTENGLAEMHGTIGWRSHTVTGTTQAYRTTVRGRRALRARGLDALRPKAARWRTEGGDHAAMRARR